MDPNNGYSQWRDDHRSILKDFPDKQIFFLFSGGKDSSIALDFISRAAQEFGFVFEVHAAPFPVHRYADAERKRIEWYWNSRGVNISWHHVTETDHLIKNAVNPCMPCREVRKKWLFSGLTGALERNQDIVVIINQTLWDLVSYSIEHILADLFSEATDGKDTELGRRFMETAQRFYPLVRMEDGYTIFRPLITYNNDDILKMIDREKIPTISIPCKFAEFRPKRILEKFYETMGMRFDYHRLFDFSKQVLDLPGLSSYTSMGKEEYLLHHF
jgi:tRNA(Ile)-lysidine synthase TilS/MesJ